MFKTTYHLFSLFGIPVKADLSLFILAFLLIQSYGSPVYGLAASVILLTSILLHELGHSLTAMAFGCRVRDITLFVLGGRASIETMPRQYWQELLMAAAGPAVSLLLSIAGLFLPILFHAMGYLSKSLTEFLLGAVGMLNFALFAFNLLPAFPMDGGRILRAVLQSRMSKVRATWIASRIGRFIAAVMIFFAICNILHIRIPTPNIPGVFGKMVWYFLSSGTFIKLLIGWMIYRAAEQEYQLVLLEEGYRNNNPFAHFGFPFFGRVTRTPPPDNGQAYVSPPPYEQGDSQKVDVRKE
jgi:Zn-dependent protease